MFVTCVQYHELFMDYRESDVMRKTIIVCRNEKSFKKQYNFNEKDGLNRLN